MRCLIPLLMLLAACEGQSKVPKTASTTKPAKGATCAAGGKCAKPSNKVKIWPVAGAKKYEGFNVSYIVAKEELKFKLNASHYGPRVVYLNAEDPAFYTRKLADPQLVLWVLTRKESVPLKGYVKRRLWEVGWRKNIQVMYMVTNNFELVAKRDGLDHITYDGQQVELPDAVLTRVGANVDYFALAVIRQLEKLGILMLNGFESINISRDKLHTLQQIAAHGVMIPKTLVAKFPIDLEIIQKEFTFPIILKKVQGTQGKGIMKLDTIGQLEDLADMLDVKHPLIFQEFIAASRGRDLRLFVVGGKVVGAMMRIASKGFKANVHQGGRVRPVKIKPQVEWLVLETVKLVGLDVAGVDLLIDKRTYKVCEVNSSPGFKGLETATGIDVASKILEYVKVRTGVWKRGRKRKRKKPLVIPVQEDHLITQESVAGSSV